MFGESRAIKPEEDRKPAGALPRNSPRSRQRLTRISWSPFSSYYRVPGQPRKHQERVIKRASNEGSSRIIEATCPSSYSPSAEKGYALGYPGPVEVTRSF